MKPEDVTFSLHTCGAECEGVAHVPAEPVPDIIITADLDRERPLRDTVSAILALKPTRIEIDFGGPGGAMIADYLRNGTNIPVLAIDKPYRPRLTRAELVQLLQKAYADGFSSGHRFAEQHGPTIRKLKEERISNG